MEYVLDSNFFIQAHRSTYPLDVAQGFWLKLKELANLGLVVSIDKVRDELYDKNDLLEDWCRANLPQSFFKDSSEVIAEYTTVVSWAPTRIPPYMQSALNDFMDADRADAFLVAYGLADSANRTIVTQEVSSPNKLNIIKIPDSCEALGIKYLSTIEMFRDIGTTF
ncbi:DUF4411 family protein [Cyclobacterium sp. SYSU L10401]|uniref:DUF4411 family protein n=1 Tax=Cyclobacterium sp. SYSU L10401 TaxID=2678657 RepID=UPI0013D1D1FB|nr:DUF4411 family protein [Cyclobacterium sp. SYSU L10401]